MYSTEYQQFSASLNELQIQVVAGNTQLASAQAKIANGVFRAVEAKMKLIGGSVNDPNIAATIDAACQKFQELLFEIIRLTKNALTERSTANLSALASKNVQACTHMLNLEIIRRNYESTVPVPSDANAERRKFLEDQEAAYQAERMAAQKKARDEAEAKVREEKERKFKQDKEREDRAREERERKAKEEETRKMREEMEIRANQERMRVARLQKHAQDEAARAEKAAQQVAEAQRKAQEKAQDDDIHAELQRAEEEVERRIKAERARLDAQEHGAQSAQTADRARINRENAAKLAEEERQRKAKADKEREEAERKLSEERVRQMNELQERKAKEEQQRRTREELLTTEKDKEREKKLKVEQAAREEVDRKQREEEMKRRKEEDDKKRGERERVAAETKKQREVREEDKKKKEEGEEEEKKKKEERERDLKLAHEKRLAAKKELQEREEAKKKLAALSLSDGEVDGSVSPRSRALSTGRVREKEREETTDGSVSPRSRALSAGTGDKWAQMIAKKQESDFKEDRERIRGRRGGGQKFVDDQIRNLIKIVKELDNEGRGLGTCNFGVLFKETMDSMPALAATLLQAKKRNIVEFEGDMLMQGVHDHVRITILTEHVADTKIYRSGSFDAAEISEYIKKQETTTGPAICVICSKQVYPTEKVVANDQVMHKSCFRCTQCNTILKLAAYAYGNGKFYCEPHFQQNFSANGYNF